nr:unnamed protein product [Callosobruchus chinensis]
MSFARRKLEAGNETSQRTKKTSRMKSVAEEISRSYNYHLPLDEQKVRVCKTFFLDTLSISAQTVRTVFNKLGSSGVVSEDKRGKVCKNSMLDESVKQSIRDHINCFETVESHYCRLKSERLFLIPTLNISKMYQLYEEYCKDNCIPHKATESMYRTVFNTEFNLSFFQPKKDLCDICHRYENGSTDEKISMGDEYQLHLKNKNLARALKAADKERAKQKTTLCCAVFDLQQVLSVPKSECIGNRGASEIGSCLLLFIETHIRKGVNEFAFYSDNCAGQNRNKYLFSLYNYLSQKYKIKIRHTFLEKGHTQSEGDSVHSAARNVPVYTPEQWYTLVRTCKRKQPYIVTELGQENIRDLKDLQEKTSINWEKNDQNERVVWNKMKIVETNFDMPNTILYKYSYEEQEPFQKIIISKKGENFYLKQLYLNSIPISKKKYDHLKFLCDKKVIQTAYHDFFKHLPFRENKQTSHNETGDE